MRRDFPGLLISSVKTEKAINIFIMRIKVKILFREKDRDKRTLEYSLRASSLYPSAQDSSAKKLEFDVAPESVMPLVY